MCLRSAFRLTGGQRSEPLVPRPARQYEYLHITNSCVILNTNLSFGQLDSFATMPRKPVAAAGVCRFAVGSTKSQRQRVDVDSDVISLCRRTVCDAHTNTNNSNLHVVNHIANLGNLECVCDPPQLSDHYRTIPHTKQRLFLFAVSHSDAA